ncbi:hypothetical protein VTJ83DRAFT_6963 [Remersonia thermophila]|uniref:Cyanovirin-N domain-containing protein n=1 Tax=Remersonia thermophila TaxID=72144 RepID=A0ABR4D670_9PEZI
MKLSCVLACLVGIASALPSTSHAARDTVKRATRPKALTNEMRSLGSAPEGFTITAITPTVVQSKTGLAKLPSTLRRRQLEPGSADFFECHNSNPRPATADCKFIAQHLRASDDEFILAPNSCLAFSYRTCQGFFCSLCEPLLTSAQFISDQLDMVDALCVEDGQAGTIVSEDAPQWDAGFTYTGRPVPTYDVC